MFMPEQAPRPGLRSIKGNRAQFHRQCPVTIFVSSLARGGLPTAFFWGKRASIPCSRWSADVMRQAGGGRLQVSSVGLDSASDNGEIREPLRGGASGHSMGRVWLMDCAADAAPDNANRLVGKGTCASSCGCARRLRRAEPPCGSAAEARK